jgi:hypothetical protein
MSLSTAEIGILRPAVGAAFHGKVTGPGESTGMLPDSRPFGL